MNILLLSWHHSTKKVIAGGFRYTKELIERLPNDSKVFVVDTKPTFFNEKKNLNIVEYIIPKKISNIKNELIKRPLEWFYSFIMILRFSLIILKREKIDAIYIPYGELLFLSFAGYVLKFLRKVKLINCVLNIEFTGVTFKRHFYELKSAGHNSLVAFLITIYSFFTRRINIWCINKADLVTTCSYDLRNKLINYGIKKNISVIPVGVNEIILKGTFDKKFDAIYIGRLNSEKGVFDLLKIWSEVVKKQNLKLVLVGPVNVTELEKIKNELILLGIVDNVLIKGVVNEKEKFKLIRQAKMLVFLSKIEGWGIVPFEALSCGLPVVAYKLPVYKETIAKCKSVFLYNLGDTMSIKRKILNLTNNYLKFDIIGKDYVKSFNWDEIAKEYFNLIK